MIWPRMFCLSGGPLCLADLSQLQLQYRPVSRRKQLLQGMDGKDPTLGYGQKFACCMNREAAQLPAAVDLSEALVGDLSKRMTMHIGTFSY